MKTKTYSFKITPSPQYWCALSAALHSFIKYNRAFKNVVFCLFRNKNISSFILLTILSIATISTGEVDVGRYKPIFTGGSKLTDPAFVCSDMRGSSLTHLVVDLGRNIPISRIVVHTDESVELTPGDLRFVKLRRHNKSIQRHEIK